MLFNNTVIGMGENVSVPLLTFPKMFERQAAGTPGLPAVRHDDATVSYGELEARANRLAHLLITLLLPRSVDIVVAQLAVLKSGAAFLPVDPDDPADRIAMMLEDTAPVLRIEHHDALRTGREVLVPMRPEGKRR